MSNYEAELAAQRQRVIEGEQAFLDDLFGYPTRPAVAPPAAEQRALPFRGTVAGDYHRWRETKEAEAVFVTMRGIAREWLVARPGRKVGARTLWEAGRRRWMELNWGVWPDNRLQADACRELEATTPDLKGMLRFRMRVEAA